MFEIEDLLVKVRGRNLIAYCQLVRSEKFQKGDSNEKVSLINRVLAVLPKRRLRRLNLRAHWIALQESKRFAGEMD